MADMNFDITILGANAALPTGATHSSAQALTIGEQLYLVDSAEGTQMQMRRYHLPLSKLKAIFISHLHGDHVFGLPGMLSSLSMLNRSAPLDVYAPQPIQEWLNTHFKFFMQPVFPLIIHTLDAKEPTVVCEEKQFTVTAFPMKHRIETYGFLFKETNKLLNIRKEMIPFYEIPLREIPAIKAGADFVTADGQHIPNARLTLPPQTPHSYAYCSDTMYLPSIAEAVTGVDLLYHEATFCEADRDRADKYYHATSCDAARIALAANAKRLILGHFSTRYDNGNQIIAEARNIFPATDEAIEGQTFSLYETRRN